MTLVALPFSGAPLEFSIKTASRECVLLALPFLRVTESCLVVTHSLCGPGDNVKGPGSWRRCFLLSARSTLASQERDSCKVEGRGTAPLGHFGPHTGWRVGAPVQEGGVGP